MDMDAVQRRYTETVTKMDAFGRALKVGRLRPSQQLKVVEFTNGSASAEMNIRLVCMVRGIDTDDLPFPRSRADVDSRIDRLESEGLEAVMEAMADLFGAAPGGEPKPAGEAAKN